MQTEQQEAPQQEEFTPVTLPEADDTATPEAPEDDDIEALAREALGETAEPLTEEELEEIEWEGVKAKVPPKLRDAFLRHKDYTQKTMSLAEERKAHKEAQEKFQKSASEIAANFQSFVELSQTQAAIQQLAALDTSQMSPQEVQAAQQRYLALQQRANQINSTLQQQSQQRAERERQEATHRYEQALSEAAARIPNFTDTRREELVALPVALGADPAIKDNITEAWEYEILHLADIGKKFIERQSRAASMKAANAGTPAKTVKGKSAGGKSLEDMSIDEFIAARNASGK